MSVRKPPKEGARAANAKTTPASQRDTGVTMVSSRMVRAMARTREAKATRTKGARRDTYHGRNHTPTRRNGRVEATPTATSQRALDPIR